MRLAASGGVPSIRPHRGKSRTHHRTGKWGHFGPRIFILDMKDLTSPSELSIIIVYYLVWLVNIQKTCHTIIFIALLTVHCTHGRMHKNKSQSAKTGVRLSFCFRVCLGPRYVDHNTNSYLYDRAGSSQRMFFFIERLQVFCLF